uniref:Uncharacterized protein n=1 Tax=Opuntia streptacantha TaxID=393608 RepID=A0A7C9E468_OPUST
MEHEQGSKQRRTGSRRRVADDPTVLGGMVWGRLRRYCVAVDTWWGRRKPAKGEKQRQRRRIEQGRRWVASVVSDKTSRRRQAAVYRWGVRRPQWCVLGVCR